MHRITFQSEASHTTDDDPKNDSRAGQNGELDYSVLYYGPYFFLGKMDKIHRSVTDQNRQVCVPDKKI